MIPTSGSFWRGQGCAPLQHRRHGFCIGSRTRRDSTSCTPSCCCCMSLRKTPPAFFFSGEMQPLLRQPRQGGPAAANHKIGPVSDWLRWRRAPSSRPLDAASTLRAHQRDFFFRHHSTPNRHHGCISHEPSSARPRVADPSREPARGKTSFPLFDFSAPSTRAHTTFFFPRNTDF